MDLLHQHLLIIPAIFFFAAFVHGSIGFGFPMLATPLLALVTDLQTAIILTLLPSFIINLVSILSEGNLLTASRRYLLLALFAMLGSACGTQILIFTSPDKFKILLAVVILLYLAAGRVNLTIPWIAANPGPAKIAFGFSAGLVGGLTNVMAPVLIIYSLEAKHSRAETIQAANSCFLLGKLAQLLMFSLAGAFTSTQLGLSLAMLPVVGLTLAASFVLKRRIQPAAYKNALKILLFLLAMALIVQVGKAQLAHSGVLFG